MINHGEINRQLRSLDQDHFLHPFTHHPEMHTQGTHIIQSAEGVTVTDDHGRKLLDGLAGLWCVNVGYGRKEITDAVQRQMDQLSFYPSFFNSTTEPTINLAKRVVELAPKNISHVFFSDSGSEANETALKLIRGYSKLKNQPGKHKILTLNYGYHGQTLATTSMTRLPSCQTPFDLPLPGFLQVPNPYSYSVENQVSPEDYAQHCLKETENLILRENPDTIAALFVEPIQGAGGVIVPPQEYLPSLRQLCRKYQILFVADEVITAFGRLGDWFASKLWNLEPDFITTAKGITSGYFPLGATLVSAPIAETLIQGGYLAHGFTYSGHPSACAAALANLDILEKENLIPRVQEVIGPYFQKKLKSLSDHPAVGEVRGFGLIGALELRPLGKKSRFEPHTPVGPKAASLVREEGAIVRGIRDIIAMAPPLIIQPREIDLLFENIERALGRLLNLKG